MSIKCHTPAGHWTVIHVHVIRLSFIIAIVMSPIPDVEDCIKVPI